MAVMTAVRTVRERLALAALLVGTGVLYLWNLSASGWANSFYSAAVQAGSQDWTALLFGSSDAANAITVDKTPAALWVMGVSARAFGFSSWSVLVPQAVMGVAAVALLYASVRRVTGPAAALLAGAALAVTPVATLMFRFNNPDALLVLLLIAAAYCVQRACEPDAGRWWLVAAGVLGGFAFLAKMMQAFLVLPAFAAAYLVGAAAPLRTRLVRLVGGLAALVVSGGWYLVLVEVWPTADRPYIGGSQHNSIVELALGYNGVSRLTGAQAGGLGNLNFDAGWDRLFGTGMGAEIAWLLPAALIGAVAGFVIRGRADRTDPARAALILWGGWLVVTAAVFSFANGIVHSYYTIALAPAVAACAAIGADLLWRHRTAQWCALTLAAIVSATAGLAFVLLARRPDWLPWLRWVIVVAGALAAVLLMACTLARVAAMLALVCALVGPVAYSVATAATPHTGAIPSVGPAHSGPPFGGAFPGPPPGGPRDGGPGRGGPPPFGGGLLDAPEPTADLIALLVDGAADYTWPAAVVGSNNAAGYQLAADVPVMAVGGFNGTDPAPTLEEFTRLVAEGRIHYFIDAHIMGGRGDHAGSHDAADIAAWVRANYPPITVGATVIYDLTES
ncbi:glycosyltransferase family 39 protein [Mycolicibacterium bacteremicum]|uniref:Glycosyl transferase n=2 Tax=Mycolicibacterium bacteremicum TaxID=564198 RepID=A0A1W9YS18_MYCBA|nr:glycosyltransferase family 39 protein [Mycolicibacterium bacteremicum]MCV7431164.1 glycosyltransferase family 39 protein [Mycolicibacterium bacteremicum]ORA02836.1 glycosyl transferase [Mycolicibacterium bacteremicum]